jgi:hypothetical protein
MYICTKLAVVHSICGECPFGVNKTKLHASSSILSKCEEQQLS